VKLRTRALLVVGSTITALSLIVFGLVAVYSYRSYRRLEHKFVKGEVDRIIDILKSEVNQVNRTGTDYANWDETYNYMVNPKQAYISANYEAETLTNLQLNRVTLIDKNNKFVFDRWFNYAEQQQVKPSFPEIQIKQQVGIAVCPNNQIFALALHPILPSNQKGNSRGWLMMARAIDDYKLDTISKQARVGVKIYNPKVHKINTQVSQDLQLNKFAIAPIDWDHIAGYATIKTLDNNQDLVLEVASNRYIYQQFIISIQFLGLAILTIGVSAGIIVTILLDRLFLSRLSQLDRQVQNIKLNPDVVPELELFGKDELKDFSIAINEMMKALEQARITTAMNKMKKNFMSVMSHELRTPMNAVLGMAQLLELTELDAEQKEYTTSILENGNDLLNLLSDILNYINLEPESLRKSNCSLTSILDDLKNKYQPLVAKKGLNLVFTTSSNLPQTIYTDGIKLQEILDRLLGNAIKFTDRGEITIEVDSDSAIIGKIHLIFNIKDTGIGIKSEELERIFEPFTMGDISSTRRHDGTGMGLAIVKRLCGLMGATISVSSELNRGTTFTVALLVEEAVLPSLVGVN